MTTTQNSTRTWMVIVTTLTGFAASAAAYPPDNAAVLYYKAFMLYQPDDEITPLLWDYWKGTIETNEKIEQYIEKNRRIIDVVLDATRIDLCDWGLDYSQGTEMLLPPHHNARELFVLLAAEATMQASTGDYRKALGRCLTLYRMARHLNERPIISYLVGTAIMAATDTCVTRFLGEMPLDVETLTWLRSELAAFDKDPYSIDHVLRWKREAGIISMSPDKIGRAIQAGVDDSPGKTKALERLREADPQFFARNTAYWNTFMDEVQAAFDLPYTEAYARLRKLDEQPTRDFDQDPDATLTACIAPTFLRIYVLDLRLRTKANALRTAVELYLTRATTGNLPETLPEGLPGDLFSGKPFQYARTPDGFVLRCRQEDLDKKEPYEYSFKAAE